MRHGSADGPTATADLSDFVHACRCLVAHMPSCAKSPTSSNEFRADMEGFDISQIVGLDETLLMVGGQPCESATAQCPCAYVCGMSLLTPCDI
ncbi:hypothetical protein [Streptomyces collinus]|uniref:hypothetical protein n=1 Tax=Streptomyces collinus TaxID=42684 RepID=UPI0029437975|nr:hypothetical protein [Streptomyces collinus]